MDVGQSTTGRVSRREAMYAEGHRALQCWGAFLRATSDGSPGEVSPDPIFREVRSGYRESSSLPTIYDEEYALLVDRLLGEVLKPLGLEIATLAYVRAMPSFAAVKSLDRSHPVPWPDRPKMVTSWDEKRRPRWTMQEYATRLDSVVGRVDMAISIANLEVA